ncbi:hypothetical protein ACTFIR_012841 [Dictyostelium discoideum]
MVSTTTLSKQAVCIAKVSPPPNNSTTTVIFMNLFTIHCTQNGVDSTFKTIMDNGTASNRLFQLLQPTHNEQVKKNDKIEGETLKKLIHLADAISNRNCYSDQDVIKNRSHYELQQYNNVLALLKIVIPDWLQTDVTIKLNTQTDISELVLNNADKFSIRRPSDSASNTGEKFLMKKNHAVPNNNSHFRNSHAQAEKIRSIFILSYIYIYYYE